jgi:hypothetical protein
MTVSTARTVCVARMLLAASLLAAPLVRAEDSRWAVTCGTGDGVVSSWDAAVTGPPVLQHSVNFTAQWSRTRADQPHATWEIRRDPQPPPLRVMTQTVCEETARWINDRCRNNLDAQGETGVDSEVRLIYAIAPWVALHWDECAGINAPPTENSPDGGQCHCADMREVHRRVDAILHPH